jgi:hypothetical protein
MLWASLWKNQETAMSEAGKTPETGPTPVAEQKPVTAQPPANGEGRDWPRAGFSLAFLVLFYAGQTVFTALGLVQLVWFLVYREPNPALQKFGPTLGQWLKEVSSYVSMETDVRPFPWAPWPASKTVA